MLAMDVISFLWERVRFVMDDISYRWDSAMVVMGLYVILWSCFLCLEWSNGGLN